MRPFFHPHGERRPRARRLVGPVLLPVVLLAPLCSCQSWPGSASGDAVKACDAEVYASLRDRSVTPAERRLQLQSAVDYASRAAAGDPRQFQPLLNIIKAEQAVSARNGYRTLPFTNQHVQELLTRAVNACRDAGQPP